MARKKAYSRQLQGVVRGLTLKNFDEICVEQELTEPDAIRQAVKEFVEKRKPIEQPKK
jgi:hypothetical protein